MVIPVLESLDIAGKTLTTDALLTQRKLATYAVERKVHYVFTVKANQPTLHEAIQLAFADRQQPDFRESPDLAHGRIEQRSIWTSTALNDNLDFPGVGQVFLIERHVIEKKTGKTSTEMAFGLTSHTPQTASAARVLADIQLQQGRPQEALIFLNEQWDSLQNSLDELEKGRVQVQMAKILRALGKTQMAKDSLATAREIFERLNAEYDLTVVREF